MLAAAGVGLALIPGRAADRAGSADGARALHRPGAGRCRVRLPGRAARRLWRPLFALAVVAVVLSAGAVAGLGVALAGLPLYAALALGAIVAPPDAAAATAILGSVSMPRRLVAVLKGESLLNDASALLLFGAATSLQAMAASTPPSRSASASRRRAADPRHHARALVPPLRHALRRRDAGRQPARIRRPFGVWIIAERLELSAVLCLVAFAMTIARDAGLTIRARSRIHSFAVWDTAVFLLNVLAFLLMGLQARTIVGGMPRRAAARGGLVRAGGDRRASSLVRMAWVLVYNRLACRYPCARRRRAAAEKREAVLIGWCGMRGLVTLATAFALPADFPQRDLIVLTAFAVVLATLVVQGLTLAPLVRLLRLDGESGVRTELASGRAELAEAALAALEGRSGPAADHWRHSFEAARAAASPSGDPAALEAKRALGLAALRRQRERLEQLRPAARSGPKPS